MYATADDLVTRYDRALLADLAGDDAAPTDPVSSARVLRALEGASGEVNAAARLGGSGKYNRRRKDQRTGQGTARHAVTSRFRNAAMRAAETS